MPITSHIKPEHMESYTESFKVIFKRLKWFDALGIKWRPHRWAYTGTYDTYNMEILLPDEKLIIAVRVKTPKFDDGKCRFFKYSYVHKVDDDGKTLDSESFTTLEMLFEVLKARRKRGDALWQDEDYRKAHGESLYFLKDYRAWQKEHGEK